MIVVRKREDQVLTRASSIGKKIYRTTTTWKEGSSKEEFSDGGLEQNRRCKRQIIVELVWVVIFVKELNHK